MSRSPRPEAIEALRSDDRLELYKHEELYDEHSIRLIKLRPAGNRSNDVECELVTENLESLAAKYRDFTGSGRDLSDETISDRPRTYEALSWYVNR